MSLQDEMTSAAEEYARRLEKAREDERLSALRLEAQHYGNASAFAVAFEEALANRTDTEHDTHPQEIQ